MILNSPLMTTILKPLLAATLEDVDSVKYPVGVTPKVDGIRALRIGESLVSRTFKDIPNKRIRQILTELLPEGADGEIIVGSTFQQVTSAVMKGTGSENFAHTFTYYWFDILVQSEPNKSYTDRIKMMEDYIANNPEILRHSQAKIVPLIPTVITNKDDLLIMETKALAEGFEGLMLRKLDGKYKLGRSTAKEGILLKMKRFKDAEATVLDFEELNHNDNEVTKDAFGNTKRSSKKEALIKGGTLGALVVKNDDGIQFKIGTGFDAVTRQEIWDHRDKYKGQSVKYKFFEQGIKTAPRFPTFIGWRLD